MTPNHVQEASPPEGRIRQDPFLFVVCQQGVEPTIKQKWAGKNSPLRLAFSRPCFLSFKFSPNAPFVGCEENQVDEMLERLAADWPVRHCGKALGNVRGQEAGAMIQEALKLAEAVRPLSEWGAVHVFQRDSDLPGSSGFEPGPTEVSESVAQLVREALADQPLSKQVNQTVSPQTRVLNILIVEPDQWLIGEHQAQRPQSCWPGGVIEVAPPTEMISRAYLKLGEAVLWSQLPMQPGDKIVEIGSSPGGSCQRLLDLGLFVTGIDPAEMHPMLLEHPRFEHWRGKAVGIRRRMFAKFRWLNADASVAPNYTLDAVEDIVNYKTSRIEGMLLTLKLTSYDLAQYMEQYVARIRSWDFERVEVRQLASNRRECCVVAQRAPGWKPSRTES